MQYKEAAHRWSISWKIVICNMCNDDWNIGHRKWSKRCSPGESQHKKKFSTVLSPVRIIWSHFQSSIWTPFKFWTDNWMVNRLWLWDHFYAGPKNMLIKYFCFLDSYCAKTHQHNQAEVVLKRRINH